MRILGIDPGYGRIGWAIVEGNKAKQTLVATGCLETNPKTSLSERLQEIYQFIREIHQKYQPDRAAVEDLFFFKNQKTVMAVAQARGVIVIAIKHQNIPCFHYTPLQIKSTIAGFGRADKKQVQLMVKSQLKLATVPKPDDAADACAVALCGFFIG